MIPIKKIALAAIEASLEQYDELLDVRQIIVKETTPTTWGTRSTTVGLGKRLTAVVFTAADDEQPIQTLIIVDGERYCWVFYSSSPGASIREIILP